MPRPGSPRYVDALEAAAREYSAARHCLAVNSGTGHTFAGEALGSPAASPVPWRMHRIWRTVLEESGIKGEGIMLHTLCHSMATLLLQSGDASLPEIPRILGHSRLDTTAVYLHVREGELRGAVQAHPLA